MAAGGVPRRARVRWRWGEPLAPLREALGRGGILAIPTESSYGLAVDPRDRRGVEAIYRVKERERGQPLPVVAASLEQLVALGVAIDEPLFRRLAAAWPAPLSLVVPAAAGLPAAAGGDTLAVRLPGHRPLLRLLGRSARRSPRPAPTAVASRRCATRRSWTSCWPAGTR